MQSCVLSSFVRCGTSKQIEKKRRKKRKATQGEIEHLKENKIKGKIDDVKKQLKPENLRIFQQTRQPAASSSSWLNVFTSIRTWV